MTFTEKIEIAILCFTVLAIFAGPVVAVHITRRFDRKRDESDRKRDIFRSLMKTRSSRLAAEHVTALNLIELEFHGRNDVIEPFRAYLQHLDSPPPAPEEQKRYFEIRNDLFFEFLRALGRELGYKFDKRDLDRLGYLPAGWVDDENVQRNNTRLLKELLEGTRPLPVRSVQIGPDDSPYPPPPQ